MTIRREHPYVWTTWLPKLLLGDNSCLWAAWLKANYQGWARAPSDFDLIQWRTRHTAMLNAQRDSWRTSGYTVCVEDQNAFRLRGHSATLAGKPDLIVVSRDHARIIDVKAGQQRDWHRLQVMIYMYAIPRALPQYRGFGIAGELVYPHGSVRIPQGGLPTSFIQDLATMIRTLGSPEPPMRVPSPRECHYCDIAAIDCPERLAGAYQPLETPTDDF